ncbi:alpha/beta-hydrolase [Aaosphaeria arxii CBS 175.79]|uniref:Alpha/beta-hydrolase n=1 Tax=Aaosphaeria arxii CBS 175.79 TaxID=1450172 RepID=A0A6A5XZ42_9PLEO|nr:alpha/beta-hydrolase [Aaosphaeria arxii CBS 175.79]KAF2018087.1 alpha/beta-hydrolase [Aaosphaeria arxii CBS 175.79]
MPAASFTVTEHRSPCTLVRQFPHGTKSDNSELYLAVKEYRPKAIEPRDNSVTIIAAHANGFPKECYEPLWEDLWSGPDARNIRAVWIADVAHQGASYALNSEELGDDPNWLDHSRDLFLLVNQFRHRMSPPFVGLGHSMGALQIINLALMHPRLLHSLIIMEPVIQDFPPPGPNAAMFSSSRRETWDSRAHAEKQISRNAFFQAMDSRVLQNYLKYGLRDSDEGKVILATPKAQEAWSYIRPNFAPLPEDPSNRTSRLKERMMNPEYIPSSGHANAMWTRPEGVLTMQSLPTLRPRTIFIYGEYSHINFDEVRNLHVKFTGTGIGGNGGVEDGGVEEQELEDAGHLCCFEKPAVVAVTIHDFLRRELLRWEHEQSFWETFVTGKSKNNRKELSDNWISGVKEDADTQRLAHTKAGPKL